jgi:Tol biopolymer transport system component
MALLRDSGLGRSHVLEKWRSVLSFELVPLRIPNRRLITSSYDRSMRLLSAGIALCALLFASLAAAASSTFPGHNGEIVFSAVMRKNGDFNLYLIRPDGTRLRRITKAKGFERYPSWSPDGRWLAYMSNRTNPRSESAYEAYVMRPNGAGLRRVTRDRWIDDQLGWAADGRRFVFESNRGGGKFGIWVMGTDGGGMKRLSGDGAVPAWSPDGKTIAYMRAPKGHDEIWLMNSDGSNQRQLTTPPSMGDNYSTDSTPDWSPAGDQIVFTRRYRGRTDVYVIRADGSGLSRLTKQAGLHSWPRWSPDGKRIVFVRHVRRTAGIYVMDAHGRNQRRIAGGGIDYAYPDWQPRR